MQRDENVMLMGEDIGVFNGAFKVTDGLLKEYGSFDHNTLKAPSVASRFIEAMPAGRKTLSQQILYPLRLNRGKFS
ncbi:MAG: hypothetical protein ACEQSX_19640, partial [Baekduiaceae bacterium]